MTNLPLYNTDSFEYSINVQEYGAFYKAVFSCILSWQQSIREIINTASLIIAAPEFKGETADAVKAYYQEVVIPIAEALMVATRDYLARFSIYMDRYIYDIDGEYRAFLPRSEINYFYGKTVDVLQDIEQRNETVNEAVKSVINLAKEHEFDVPSISSVRENMETTITFLANLDQKIMEYEDSTYNEIRNNLLYHISAIGQSMNYLNNKTDRSIISYEPGSFVQSMVGENLNNWTIKTQEYVDSNMAVAQSGQLGITQTVLLEEIGKVIDEKCNKAAKEIALKLAVCLLTALVAPEGVIIALTIDFAVWLTNLVCDGKQQNIADNVNTVKNIYDVAGLGKDAAKNIAGAKDLFEKHGVEITDEALEKLLKESSETAWSSTVDNMDNEISPLIVDNNDISFNIVKDEEYDSMIEERKKELQNKQSEIYQQVKKENKGLYFDDLVAQYTPSL
ncbi:MAG: hypothetical protein E7488_08110 [Ruminococcaceae bacterium]|nr:hypothetical protein [Oscillospiraceae bacterium]